MIEIYVKVNQWLTSLTKRQEGQSMTEYALVLALIAIVVIAILTTMGDTIKAVFTKVNAALDAILQSNP